MKMLQVNKLIPVLFTVILTDAEIAKQAEWCDFYKRKESNEYTARVSVHSGVLLKNDTSSFVKECRQHHEHQYRVRTLQNRS